MSGSPHGSKHKSSAGGGGCTKRARGTNTKEKAPNIGGTASTSSAGPPPGAATGAASAEKDKEENETRARRRNPHGIAPDDVDDKAKQTQAFQCHIRMAAGLLTADAVLEPADDYLDHYDKCFNESDDMEGLMWQIIAEAKKPNKDAQKRAERLIRDAKVITRGEALQGGTGNVAVTRKVESRLEMYDNFMFGTIKTNGHKENNSPGSLSKALDTLKVDKCRIQLCVRRYREAKAKGYRKPILRLLKVKAAHSDDERPPGGDAKKKKGLNICTKDGRSEIVTAFVRELDSSLVKRIGCNPNRNKKVPEMRTVTDPPTPSSALSRVLPVGVPIDFWDPKFYNEELDVQEKAMYINTGQVGQNASEGVHGNEVLTQYNLPTPEEIAALGLDKDSDEGSDADNESTDLEDTNEEDKAMHE
ncbi:hypothetical protein B0H14DRAFT_2557019 [Mycena olivaceomarginata]|nr:hypothetical protein B0H14DRAFT_2557019 [Mycena olivaceomarginata]